MKSLFLFILVCPAFLDSLSLNSRTYKTSSYPIEDLKVITAQETNFISKQWYNKIMYTIKEYEKELYKNKKLTHIDRLVKTKKYIETSPQNYILSSINTLEGYFQGSMKESYLYLAWMPEEETLKSAKDVLALVVCNKEKGNTFLKCVIPNPSWSCENIESKELKRCIESIETTTHMLNVTEFYSNPDNIRFKLDWIY